MKNIAQKTNIIAVTSLLSIGVMAPNVQADVPNTFTSGDAIIASEMNANFSALDERLSALEGNTNQTVNIDCDNDATTFKNTTIQDNTTYVITGICNGPIEIFRKRNVFIHGDATGSKDDGIILPANLTVNPYAAVGYYESSGELRNLTINASNYVSNGTGYGWPNAGALDGTVSVGQASVLKLYDVDILGGDYGLNVYRGSYAKTYSNVGITGFNLGGVTASINSHAELSDTISVVGTSTSTSSDSFAVSAGRNSHVDIKGGGTFTPGVSSSPNFPTSLVAYENGTIRVRNSSTEATLNERIIAYSGGLVRVSGNTTVTSNGVDANNGGQIWFQNGSITGGIDASDSSYIRIDNSSQAGGVVYANRSSTIRITGSSSIDTTGFAFGAQHSSSFGFRDTTTVTGNTLGLYLNSTVYIHDSVNFGSVGVNCQSRTNQLAVGANTTLGDISGCP
jgi:hypothetical protein